MSPQHDDDADENLLPVEDLDETLDLPPEDLLDDEETVKATPEDEPDFFADEASAEKGFLGDDNMNPYLTDEMTDFLNDRITDYSAI